MKRELGKNEAEDEGGKEFIREEMYEVKRNLTHMSYLKKIIDILCLLNLLLFFLVYE